MSSFVSGVDCTECITFLSITFHHLNHLDECNELGDEMNLPPTMTMFDYLFVSPCACPPRVCHVPSVSLSIRALAHCLAVILCGRKSVQINLNVNESNGFEMTLHIFLNPKRVWAVWRFLFFPS